MNNYDLYYKMCNMSCIQVDRLTIKLRTEQLGEGMNVPNVPVSQSVIYRLIVLSSGMEVNRCRGQWYYVYDCSSSLTSFCSSWTLARLFLMRREVSRASGSCSQHWRIILASPAMAWEGEGRIDIMNIPTKVSYAHVL